MSARSSTVTPTLTLPHQGGGNDGGRENDGWGEDDGWKGSDGFTLLEVMIALAILSIALVALGDINGTAVQMHQYASRSTVATFLARTKMQEIEDELQKDGFSDFDDSKDGNFDEAGWSEYRWVAKILKPDIQVDASQLMSMIGGATGLDLGPSGGKGSSAPAAGSSGKSSGVLAAAGPFAGMVQAQLTNLLEELKHSVREVKLTVRWKDGSREQKMEVATHLVILPGMVNKSGPTAHQLGAPLGRPIFTPKVPAVEEPDPWE